MSSHISIENHCLIYKLLDFNTLNINKISKNSKLYLDENVKNKTLFTLFNPRVMFLSQQPAGNRTADKSLHGLIKGLICQTRQKKIWPGSVKKLKVWHGSSKFLKIEFLQRYG